MSPDNSSGTPVSAIMTKNLITVDSDTTVFQIANLMEKGGIGAILVKRIMSQLASLLIEILQLKLLLTSIH